MRQQKFKSPRRRFSDEGGNVAFLAALVLPIGLGVAGLAVDVGALFLERREAQSLTDLAAIYAAGNISSAETAAIALFHANREPFASLVTADSPQPHLPGQKLVSVEKGRYSANASLAPEARFVAGASPPNAVRVTYRKTGTAYFAASLISDKTIATSAVATAPAEAAISLGTRLASANLSAGILNGLLGEMLGTNVSLNLMDYNALLAADANVLSVIDALATDLSLTTATYNEVMNTDVTVGRIARALAAVNSEPKADVALAKLFGVTGPSASLKLSSLIDLGNVGRLAVGRGAAAFDTEAGLLEMVTASAAIANGKDQVAVNLTQDLGGLLGVKVNLAIGEPPLHKWLSVGEQGQVMRTSQTQLKVEAAIGTGGVLGGLLGTDIKLPVYVELAYAQAQTTKLACPSGRPTSATVTVAVQPGIADTYVGEVNPSSFGKFGSPLPVADANIVNVTALSGLLKIGVTGKAHAQIGNSTATNVTFNSTEIANNAVKNVTTNNYTTSLTGSLINDLKLDAKVNVLGILPLGLGIPSASTVKSTVTGLLAGATVPVDNVLFNVLSAVGVRVGEADVRVTGISCNRSVLVN